MKRTANRWIAMVLTVILVIGALPLYASADEPKITSIDFGEVSKESFSAPAAEGNVLKGSITYQNYKRVTDVASTNPAEHLYIRVNLATSQDLFYKLKMDGEANYPADDNKNRCFYSYDVDDNGTSRIGNELLISRNEFIGAATIKFQIKAIPVLDRNTPPNMTPDVDHTPTLNENDAKEYTVELNVLAGQDTDIAKVEIKDAVNVTVNNTNHTITAVMPFGYLTGKRKPANPGGVPSAGDLTINMRDTNAVGFSGQPADYDISKSSAEDVKTGAGRISSAVKLHVKSEAEAKSAAYTMSLTEATPFEAFSIEGQLGMAEIDIFEKTITIQMPKNTELSGGKLERKLQFTAENFAEVKMGTAGVTLESGKTYDFAEALEDTNAKHLSLTIKDKLRPAYSVNYRLCLTTEKSADHSLEEIYAGRNENLLYTGRKSGSKGIGIEVGSNVTLSTAYLKVVAAKGARIEFPEIAEFKDFNTALAKNSIILEQHPYDNSKYIVIFPSINLEAAANTNGTTLNITSENTANAFSYNLKIAKTAQEIAKPVLTSIRLVTDQINSKTGARLIYDGTIQNDSGKISFLLPYAVNLQTMERWFLEYKTDSGIQFGYMSGTTAQQPKASPVSLSGLLGKDKLIPDPTQTAQKTTVYVAAFKDDGTVNSATKKEYTVEVLREEPKTGSAARSIAVSREKDLRLIENNAHNDAYPLYSGTITSQSVGFLLNPGDYSNADELYLKLDLDEGAKAYYFDGTTYTEVVAINDVNPANAAELANVTRIDASGVKTKGSKKLVVINERANTTISGSPNVSTISSVAGADKTEYYIVADTSTQSSDAVLKSFYLETHKTGSKVTGAIKGDKLSLELKYSYSDGKTRLYPWFELPLGAVLKAQAGANTYQFVNGGLYDAEGNLVDSSSNAYMSFENGKVYICGSEVKELIVENGSKRSTYTLSTTVLKAETEARMVRFSLDGYTGIITADKILVTVPVGTALTAMEAKFSTSTMAAVMNGATELASGKSRLDLSGIRPVELQVISEDGKTTKTYALSVEEKELAFEDVKLKDWFYDEVMEAAKLGIVNGISPTKFDPNGNIKRGDFALMVARMLGADLTVDRETGFPDVSKDAYYASAIGYVSEKKIVLGFDDGTFRPEAYIKRQEVAAMLSRILKLEKVDEPDDPFIDHEKIPDWACPDIYACKEAKILLGDDTGRFNPEMNMIRAEAAIIVVRTLKKME